MKHAVKRPAQPADELFPSPHQGAVGLTPAHRTAPGEREPALPAASGPTLSRRSMVATLVAAIAPVAGTAAALPKAVDGTAAALSLGRPAAPPVLPAIAEDPALLALGVELEERQSAYRAAVARLEQARAVAAEQWPEPPPSIVITSAADRRVFQGCFEQAEGFEGQPLYRTIVDANGTVHPDAAWLNLLKPDRLRIALAAVRGDTERWGGKRARQRLEGNLTARIVAAERYGAQCARAIEVSGIEAGRDAAHSEANKIHSLLYRIRQHAPLTVSGMLILARGMMLFEEAQKSNYCGGEQGRGLLLGRELADAVLRIAGVMEGSEDGTLPRHNEPS